MFKTRDFSVLKTCPSTVLEAADVLLKYLVPGQYVRSLAVVNVGCRVLTAAPLWRIV